MKTYWAKPVKYEIKQRTFEGKTDSSKNDHSLTSKYMPSHRYYMEIEFKADDCHDAYITRNTYRTKADALAHYELCVKRAGQPM